MNKNDFLESIDFEKGDGLVPTIIQDYESNEILMMAYMNRESLQKTIEAGKTWFWSRSRNGFWNKGETSGHFQTVKEMFLDCDGDTLLIKVDQVGAACHTGSRSCFFRKLDK
ncbi:phosphoribosyl-AMP cyclohydrolase [Clostridium sp. DL1XJH146]